MIQLHWVQYYDLIKFIPIWRIKRIEFHSLFHITFNYLDLDVPPFTFHVEYGERLSQPCSDEYDWFSPDLLQNNWGGWCTNITGGSKYYGFPTLMWSYRYPVIHILCRGWYNIYMPVSSMSVCNTPPPPSPPKFRGIWKPCGYNM